MSEEPSLSITQGRWPKAREDALTPGLTLIMPVRNAKRLDYCYAEAIRSVLEICNKVIISDAESDDGTLEEALEWATYEPKISVHRYKWPVVPTWETVKDKLPGPPGDPWLLSTWINTVREIVTTTMLISLDADEVVDPGAFDRIREAVRNKECLWMWRNHYWGSANFMVPQGWVAGNNVTRVLPTALWCPSDNPHHLGEPTARIEAKFHPSLIIHHYGFLRKDSSFIQKSKEFQSALVNSMDDRILKAEELNEPWWVHSTFPAPLIPYEGSHPPLMTAWLTERGRFNKPEPKPESKPADGVIREAHDL